LKEEAREKGSGYLMGRLFKVDPAYAATMTSENDLVRIIRALEVYETTGTPFSVLHEEHRARTQPLPAIQVAIEWERKALYERIDRRVDRMIEEGWGEEVQALLDEGYGPHLERLKALGYREIAAFLRGEQTLDAAIAAAKQHHRRYAKRQLTWFRADARVQWIPATPDTSAAALAEQILESLFVGSISRWDHEKCSNSATEWSHLEMGPTKSEHRGMHTVEYTGTVPDSSREDP